MTNLLFNLLGISEIARKFTTAPIRTTLELALKKATYYAQAEAIKETPVDRGQLRNSYDTEFGNLQGRLFNKKEYATFVHEGTGIYAKSGGRGTGWLWFSSGGKYAGWHFTRGQRANPWMDRTAQKVNKQVDSIFDNEIAALIANKL